MNQTKIPWTLLITLLAAVVFGFFCFVSLNFLTLGDMPKSAIGAVIITLLLGGLCAGAIIMKRTDHNFKTSIIIEWVLLFLFLVCSAIFIYKPFTHYFAVSANKENIQEQVLANLNQAENMFNEYRSQANNRLDNLEKNLNTALRSKKNKINDGKYKDYGFTRENENTHIKDQKDLLKGRLLSDDVDTLEMEVTKKVIEWKDATLNWKPLGVVNTVNQAENYLTECYQKLVEISKNTVNGDDVEEFSYPITFTDMTTYLNDDSTKAPASSLLYGIGLCLLMLLSYIVTGRHPRYPGLKLIFNNTKVMSDKEL